MSDTPEQVMVPAADSSPATDASPAPLAAAEPAAAGLQASSPAAPSAEEESVNAMAVFSRELTRAIDLAGHHPDGLIDVNALRSALDSSNLPSSVRAEHPLMFDLDKLSQNGRFHTEAKVSALFAGHGVTPIQIVLPAEYLDAPQVAPKEAKPAVTSAPVASHPKASSEAARAPRADSELEALIAEGMHEAAPQQRQAQQFAQPGKSGQREQQKPGGVPGFSLSFGGGRKADKGAEKKASQFAETAEAAKAAVPDGQLDAHLCSKLLDRVVANTKALTACVEEVKEKPGPGLAHTRREIGNRMSTLMDSIAGDTTMLRDAGVEKMDDRLADRAEKVSKDVRKAAEAASTVSEDLDPETRRKFQEMMDKMMASIREMVEKLMKRVSHTLGLSR